MFSLFVSAAPQPRVVAPSVDFRPHHEVVLLCSATRRRETSELAESLLALGFDALVLCGSLDEVVDGLPSGASDPGPALLVPCDREIDTPVLRSRVRRTFHREHLWLDAEAGSTALDLQRKICAKLDELERERTQEVSIEPVDVDEVSNVILLPVAPQPAPQTKTAPTPANTAPRKPSRIHYVLWPVIGATVTALGMAAVRPSADSGSDAAAEADVAKVAPPVPVDPQPDLRESRPEAPVVAAPPPPPAASAPDTPVAPAAPTDSAEAAALAHERVTATDDYLVFEAGEKPRDWYAAMNLCRGRTHAGLTEWTTPSSRQLHALAKARVLPEAPLWSRTRSMRDTDVAFVVHGHAGTLRSEDKTESISAAVCIRKRADSKGT